VTVTIHRTKEYGHLVAQCQGFLGEAQLLAHFELYQGYVKKLNILSHLDSAVVEDRLDRALLVNRQSA